MPAVSIKVIFLFLNSSGTSIESLVVPDSEDTTNLSSPIRAFTSVDLPAFGLPIIEIFTESLSYIESWLGSESSYSERSSLNSENPLLCDAERKIVRLKPKLINSAEDSSSLGLSALLINRVMFLFCFLRDCAIS